MVGSGIRWAAFNRASLVFSVSLAFVVGLANVGCGGSSDDDPADGGGGRLTLPPGVVAAEVVSAAGASPVTGATFAPRPPASGRLLTLALSAEGAPLLAGWIGEGHSELTPRTTAEVIAFFAVGAHALPAGVQAPLQAMLADVPQLDPLAQAIEGALAADPRLFEAGADALAPAIREAAAALFDHGGAGALRVRAQGLLINPAEERSGLRLDTVSGANEIQITNRYRRPAYAFVDRVSTFAGEVETASPEVITRVDVAPVTGLAGGVGTIAQILSGAVEPGGFFASQDVAYVPKQGAPIHLPNLPGATRTRYRVAIVGPGLNIGDHGQLTAAEREKQTEVILAFLIKDFLLPLLIQIVVPAADLEAKLDSDIAGDVVQDLISVLTEGAPSIQQKAAAGQIDEAVAELWNVTVRQGWVRDAILALVIDALFDAAEEAAAARATALATKFIAVSGALDSALTSFDLTLVGRSMQLANIADVWTVDARDAKVVLTPPESEVKVGEFVTLEARVVDAGEDDHFEYRFTTAGRFGALQGEFERGTAVTGTSPFVTFDAQRVGTESIRVEVLEIVEGLQARRPIGETTATVTVVDSAVTILPGHVDLEPGARTTLSAEVVGDGFAMPLTYRWSTAATFGTFTEGTGRPATVTHEVPALGNAIEYEADADAGGTETISLEVYDAEGELVGADQAFIAIGCDATPQTAQRFWRESRGAGGCAGCEYYQGLGYYIFDLVPGVRTYVMGVERGESIFSTIATGNEIDPFQPTGQASRYYYSAESARRNLDPEFIAAISHQLTEGKALYLGVAISQLVHPDDAEDLAQWRETLSYNTQGFDAFDLTLTPVCP